MDIKNKNIVVTGASDGLGRATASKLAAQGSNLALVARNHDRLNSLVEELSLKYPQQKFIAYFCDISQLNQIKTTVKKIISDFEDIHILLNIAGIWQKMSPLENINVDDIQIIIQTNLVGLIQITNQLLPNLKNQSEAIIINDSSSSGIMPRPEQAVYCASKYGVTGFTEVLKVDLKGSNVRVAGLYQGGTNTQMFSKANDLDKPLNDFTDPNDLADVIVFMLTRPAKIWLHDIRVTY
ncbi:MAG TPA: SDR family oxidoreductase [Candidatus Methanoperedens sp.]|nr:SDR family oxidoreductase [Candidatus Methanoperedens sp.]